MHDVRPVRIWMNAYPQQLMLSQLRDEPTIGLSEEEMKNENTTHTNTYFGWETFFFLMEKWFFHST